MPKEFHIRVIDGASSDGGDVWSHMSKTVDAETPEAALDMVEAELNAGPWPVNAAAYGVAPGEQVLVTIQAYDERNGRCSERALLYPTA